MTKTIYHGEVLGSTTAAQLPAITYRYGWIKAQAGNSGNVYVGSSSDVTIAGSTDTNITCGLELDAGQDLELPLLPVDGHFSLSDHWYICDNATDDIIYYLVDW